LIAFLAVLMLHGFVARADMDLATQNVLIDKLEKIYQTLPNSDSAKVGVTLRLADLYAERARRVSVASVDGCADCKEPGKDREKALRLYSEVLPKAPESSRPKVILQMGHLQQMNGNEAKAIALYEQNLHVENDPQLQAEANLSLAEIYFKRRQFPKAIQHYDLVLKNPAATSKGLAAYRRAWSYYNIGQIPQAISELEKVLTTPELLSRSGSAQASIDNQFHEEVSRDYSTFLAKASVTKDKVNQLLKLSPKSTRLANGQNLAFELERTGKRDEALLAWEVVGEQLSVPSEKLAAQLSMAQLYLDKQNKADALKKYEFAMQSWKDQGYKDTTAEQELKRRARHFVVAWNQIEKKDTTPELLSAYENYLAMFPSDVDAQLFAAQTATQQKNFKAAWDHYMAARAELLKDQNNKEAKDKLETVVLRQIEIAEQMKDPAIADLAYDSYIQYSPKKTKLLEVQYQKAHALYDKADYAKASEELRNLALNSKGNPTLRKQAADLSLDALVLIKDDSKLVAWAKDYEKAFPNNKSDFSQIIQKTTLTKSAALAEANPAEALAALGDFDPSKATAEDKVKFYRNKLILAEKTGHIKEASSAADSLLALPQASAADKELAYGRKAYFAELRLDFTTAFAATEKLEKSLPVDEKNFKLAVFAELAGRQSAPFYMNYLAQTKDAERKPLVAAELVRKSKNPDVEIEKVKNVLTSNPALLAQLYAEAYAKTGKEALLKKVVGDAKLKDTDAGKLLQRQAFLKDFAAMKKPLAADKLDTKNQSKLAASIKRRAALLVKAEDFVKRSIQSGDWTAQLLAIDLIAREADRFYQDLLSAPMPAGLTPEEEQEYMQILSQQAMPYQTKAAEAKTKVGQFWGDSNWQEGLTNSWRQQDLRKLINVEVAALKEIAPAEQIAKLETFKEETVLKERPSVQEIQAARQKVFDNPMDKTALEGLLQLERKSDNLAMSAYLANRIERLNKGTL
jgi:tetratricopeptide (TPR) repeat protein